MRQGSYFVFGSIFLKIDLNVNTEWQHQKLRSLKYPMFKNSLESVFSSVFGQRFAPQECASAESLGWTVRDDMGRHAQWSSAGATGCVLISNQAEVGAWPLSVTTGKYRSPSLCPSWPADATTSFSTTMPQRTLTEPHRPTSTTTASRDA